MIDIALIVFENEILDPEEFQNIWIMHMLILNTANWKVFFSCFFAKLEKSSGTSFLI